MTDEGRWVRRVELTPPRLEDNRGDADRLLAGLRHALGTGEVGLDPRLLPRLPDLLRRSGWKPRCALFLDRGRWHLLDVLDPDRAATACGVAVDLGTTRIALRLVDLETGAALGDRSLDNPQREVGPDILTRVHFAAREGGLERLRSLAVEGVNEGVAALCADAGLEVRDVRLLAVAGNTTSASSPNRLIEDGSHGIFNHSRPDNLLETNYAKTRLYRDHHTQLLSYVASRSGIDRPNALDAPMVEQIGWRVPADLEPCRYRRVAERRQWKNPRTSFAA